MRKWVSFSHLRRNSTKLKSLKSHQNFSFWPIFKNSGPKCAEDQGLWEKTYFFFWDSLKGSKILKNQKNCPEFWVFGFFCLFWTPPNFFFSFFLKYMSRRKFWYTTFENRIKTKVAGTFWVFDTCRPYFDPPCRGAN